MKNLNNKIIQLFEKILVSGKLIEIKDKALYFNLKGLRLKVEYYPISKQEDYDIQPLDMETLLLPEKTFKIKPSKSHLYSYVITTPFGKYVLPKITLAKQEEYMSKVNDILSNFEDFNLNRLINEF